VVVVVVMTVVVTDGSFLNPLPSIYPRVLEYTYSTARYGTR